MIQFVLAKPPPLFTFFSVGRICELLDSVPKIEPDSRNPKELCKPASFAGEIEFKDIHFNYPSVRDKNVLNGVSFTVKSGQKVALVGPAGCGKSSCLRLIERFYLPDKGSIIVDGKPIEEYDVHNLRRHIALVSQDNILFDKSIKENITYGLDPEPNDAAVKDACDKANAWEFIRDFPEGLHTVVGQVTCMRVLDCFVVCWGVLCFATLRGSNGPKEGRNEVKEGTKRREEAKRSNGLNKAKEGSKRRNERRKGGREARKKEGSK
jgi:ABC-type sugar transport system ATPase subunit